MYPVTEVQGTGAMVLGVNEFRTSDVKSVTHMFYRVSPTKTLDVYDIKSRRKPTPIPWVSIPPR